jgi:hypothetical protein
VESGGNEGNTENIREGTVTEMKKRRVKETAKRRIGWTKEKNEIQCAFETLKT